jgi:uncharacterized protein
MYMLMNQKVAGCSGAVNAMHTIHATTRDSPKLLFLFGLLASGLVTSFITPWGFEAYGTLEQAWPSYIFGGWFIGFGTYLGNGCTSGHGLSGLSRLSLRSLIATPLFMFCASIVAMIKSSFAVGPIVPFAETPISHLESTGYIAIALFVLQVPLYFIQQKSLLSKYYVAVWCGITFGSGLSIGGMVRPSAVVGALAPVAFDFTLWILFTTALIVTFIFYRIAEYRQVEAARAKKQGPYPTSFLVGCACFGIGWGLTGLCPGPLVVGILADLNASARGLPVTGGPIVCFIFVFIGSATAKFIEAHLIHVKHFDALDGINVVETLVPIVIENNNNANNNESESEKAK